MAPSINIQAKDTIAWKYIFKIYPSNTWPVRVYILDQYRKQIWNSFVKLVKLPKDINKISKQYKDKIIFGLKQWYIQLYKNWYFSPTFDLRWKDLTIWRNVDIPDLNKNITRQQAAYWIVKTR